MNNQCQTRQVGILGDRWCDTHRSYLCPETYSHPIPAWNGKTAVETMRAWRRWAHQRNCWDFFGRCEDAAADRTSEATYLVITRPEYTDGRQREVYQGA